MPGADEIHLVRYGVPQLLNQLVTEVCLNKDTPPAEILMKLASQSLRKVANALNDPAYTTVCQSCGG